MLKNLTGGLIRKPKFYHNTITDQQQLNQSYNINSADILSKSTDVEEPYLDKERYSDKTKITDYNKTGSYATMPPVNSPLAYNGEGGPLGGFNTYCVRSPYYPPPNVRFVSYNVHNFVKQCKTSNTIDNIGRNLDYAIDTIRKLNGDILFLQEITPEFNPFPVDGKENESGNFDSLVSKLKELGYDHYFIGDTHYSTKPDALDVNYPYFMLCNATFSKYPIIKNYSVALGNNRICVHTLIELTDYYVSAYNVHIEFDNRQFDKLRNIEYKFTQINKLAKYIYDSSIKIESKYFIKPIFYILGGDFNNDYYRSNKLFSPLTSIMTKLNPLLSIKKPVPANRDKITGQNVGAILDIFFISGPTNYNYNPDYLIIPDNHSDHYPIIYDFMPMKILI